MKIASSSRGALVRALSLASIALVAACTSSGVKVDQSKLGALQPGMTTVDQAIAALGKPTNTIIQSDGGRIIQYTYIHAQAKAINFVPVVGLFAGGADTETTTLTVNFGKDGKMTNYTSSQGSNEVGTGLASGHAQ